MTRIWDTEDAVVWACAPVFEALGNQANYNVVSGCGSTPSGANLNVTVAAGTVTHNGSSVTVAGNSVTLVADATYARWSWVSINSSGTAVLTSGTPASDPTIPDYGDTVPVYLVKVTANATVASSITSKYDFRIFAPTNTDTSAATLANDVNCAASTTLGNITGLSASLTANTTYLFRGVVNYTAAAAADYKLGVTVPSGATVHMMCAYTNTSGTGTVSSITASGSSISANGFGASTPGTISFWGIVMGTYSAGTLQLQHAPVAVSGTTTCKAKSRLEVY